MFIRFVSAEIDESSLVLEGLFGAAYRLWSENEMPEYELDALIEVKSWFDVHLESPLDYLPWFKNYDRAICWFKPTAREYLARAWEMVSILERNDVPIWVVKSESTGYVYYEDEAQVFAEPFRNVRFRLNRSRL